MYREQVPSAEINPKVGVAIKMNVTCGCCSVSSHMNVVCECCRGCVQSYECTM